MYMILTLICANLPDPNCTRYLNELPLVEPLVNQSHPSAGNDTPPGNHKQQEHLHPQRQYHEYRYREQPNQRDRNYPHFKLIPPRYPFLVRYDQSHHQQHDQDQQHHHEPPNAHHQQQHTPDQGYQPEDQPEQDPQDHGHGHSHTTEHGTHHKDNDDSGMLETSPQPGSEDDVENQGEEQPVFETHSHDGSVKNGFPFGVDK